MLNREKITAALKEEKIAYELRCLEETDSTNLQCRQAALAGGPHGLVMTAEKQRAGRGRRGRSWDSASGENLYFSLLLLPEFPQEKASMLTLVAALAVTEAIRETGADVSSAGEAAVPVGAEPAGTCSAALDARIKWPNDVVVEGCKVCGILTELGWRADGRYFVIVGIGINVNQSAFPEEIAATATSFFLKKGARQDREELLAAILDKFSFYYGRFAEVGNLAGLQKDYEKLLVNCGQTVKVLDPKGEWTGTALGINETGELLVRHEDGALEAVYAGEVSVRGIYGYV